MSAPVSLVPGNYVIFAEDPSGTTSSVVGRSNFAVTSPLSSGASFTLTSLTAASSAGPTQLVLVTGEGMILSQANGSGQLGQSPTFYASFSNNSQNIVTTNAPASPSPSTKFVIHVNQTGPSNHSDALCYLTTIMTADLSDQYWTVDALVGPFNFSLNERI
uniref:Uncharacterized protein n=1 Tax=Psilocybe cubensis TaxID=181762 RepID=A0A8H8CQR1_PSICU